MKDCKFSIDWATTAATKQGRNNLVFHQVQVSFFLKWKPFSFASNACTALAAEVAQSIEFGNHSIDF